MGGKPNELNERQRAFVREYLVDLNGKQAATRAGYSAKTAEWLAVQLLKKPHVAQAVQSAMAKRAARVELTADKVLEDIIRIGKSAEEAGKHNEALKACELLGKHLKLFTDKIQADVDATITTVRWAGSEDGG